MNHKQRRRLKKLQGKNGGKKGLNPYFVATESFNLGKSQKGGERNGEKES